MAGGGMEGKKFEDRSKRAARGARSTYQHTECVQTIILALGNCHHHRGSN